MSSAYRSPQDQLRVIQDLVHKYNADPKNSDKISLPHNLSVNKPQTWLPALVKLRKRFAVNAPIPVRGISASPHSAFRVVFDLANPERTSKKLNEIKEACISAERRGLVGFNQIKVEPDPKRMAAAQGYSVAVDLGLTPQEPPTILYHGPSACIVESGHYRSAFYDRVRLRLGDVI
jgi:hypothetical protein